MSIIFNLSGQKLSALNLSSSQDPKIPNFLAHESIDFPLICPLVHQNFLDPHPHSLVAQQPANQVN